jgi:leucyl aminopeptidase
LTKAAIPLVALPKASLASWLAQQPASLKRWVKAQGFEAKPGAICLVPSRQGGISLVLAGLEEGEGPWAWGGLPSRLPKGNYRINVPLSAKAANDAALGWRLGCYNFLRYKKKDEGAGQAVLLWPKNADRQRVENLAEAIFLVRDLVNTPAADLGPRDLAQSARDLASRFAAKVSILEGQALLKAGYPAIHAVGKGSARPPLLIDLTWGAVRQPLVTLVGKGVCFDSGGLDLKPSSAMKIMKKDMGGAAHALALALLVMAAKLPVRLRVLIPAVENMPGPGAMRPLDVLATRKGLSVEVGNTDAEGRLILADALAEACRDKPELLIDFATLTGAARSALGPDLPALFSNDDDLAALLIAKGQAESDPLWRLPLWPGYRKMLESRVADLNSAPDSPFAGAITAALFLENFVEPAIPWIHLDLFAWNAESRPGRPAGGEAMTLRALFALLAERYA